MIRFFNPNLSYPGLQMFYAKHVLQYKDSFSLYSILSLPMEGRKRPKKEANCPRLVGIGFYKQRNLVTRLVLGTHKTGRP